MNEMCRPHLPTVAMPENSVLCVINSAASAIITSIAPPQRSRLAKNRLASKISARRGSIKMKQVQHHCGLIAVNTF